MEFKDLRKQFSKTAIRDYFGRTRALHPALQESGCDAHLRQICERGWWLKMAQPTFVTNGCCDHLHEHKKTCDHAKKHVITQRRHMGGMMHLEKAHRSPTPSFRPTPNTDRHPHTSGCSPECTARCERYVCAMSLSAEASAPFAMNCINVRAQKKKNTQEKNDFVRTTIRGCHYW
jgi:hypothetical protein